MAQRKGGLSDLMEVAAKLPWQVSAALVPISFFVCHFIAAAFPQTAPVTDLRDMGTVVIREFIQIFGVFGQYALPLVFAITAIVSFVRRSHAKALLNGARANPTAAISAMSWQEFETLVGEGFRTRGFQVSERGGAGPDGGIDLALRRDSERFLVQCKQWRAQQVGVSVVRELYGVMAAERVAGGYVVTSGTFTKDAKEFASGRNIELIDGKGLDGLLRDGRSAVPTSAAKNVVELKPEAAAVAPVPFKASPPTCPRCKSPMVMRVAKQGKNAGGSFWGCSQYPKCRQIVRMG
jgi:restriction system protein